jgi:hypothetical protein
MTQQKAMLPHAMQATLSIYKASTNSYTVEVATASSARRFQTISPHPLFWLMSALKDEVRMVEAIVLWNEPTHQALLLKLSARKG